MDVFALLRNPKRMMILFLAYPACGFLCTSSATAADMMSAICNNQVVSVGDRQGEVLTKCGNPLSKSHETVDTGSSQVLRKRQTGKKKMDKDRAGVARKKTDKEQVVATRSKTTREREETWTYNIDGSYRFFIFKEGKLANIEAGGLVN
ncbi:MAG TPA: DUF2845 domain-containing protein [Syntrophales bacterium]|nr:DUF2845 domain-containing protein [Syntrophales bacterium]